MGNKEFTHAVNLGKIVCEWDEKEMILIPEGEFIMGVNENKKEIGVFIYGAETPEHRVYLDAYYVAKYPVTNSQYKKFIDETHYSPPKYFDDPEFNGPKYPVVGINWYDANAFCEWLSKKTGKQYRLPTEAEWEKACRGTDGRSYPWGNEEPTPMHANFNEHVNHTTPVDAYPINKSPYGCMDMVGNVVEWCSDWFDYDFYKKSPYKNPKGPETQPKGPMTGKFRSFKGGYWRFNPLGIQCSYRSGHNPSYSMNAIGFRCTRTL